MIVFENQQEIDICAISTFGVSVKESDNPIGFFGTGLKYAIAVLLRTEHKVVIYSGLTAVEFGIRHGSVRGQEFEFITMSVNGGNPIDIGFTTQLGKTWEMWMAYRELACNCKDEGGEVRIDWSMPEPEAGKTKIIVIGQEFEKAYANRHEYILEDEPDLVLGSIELRRRPGGDYYYRGVRVMRFDTPCLFTYNDTAALDLTEDRTVKYQWEPADRVASALLKCEDARILRSILTAKSIDCMEGGLSFGSHSKPGEMFLRVVGELVSDRVTNLNPTALKVWEKHTKRSISPTEVSLTAVQAKALEKALDFCDQIGFRVRGSYPVKVVESLGEGTLGLAYDNTIFLAERTFHMGGSKQVASTLVEEYLHLRHGYKDCTRELQSFLFEKLISMGEEMTGEPL